MTRSLIVDGTKEVIANGRSVTMHAISKPTDYTHTRIVGYAVSLEDAQLFAAAEKLREACKAALVVTEAEGARATSALVRSALSKSEVAQ
jgi:hypothetical protein